MINKFFPTSTAIQPGWRFLFTLVLLLLLSLTGWLRMVGAIRLYSFLLSIDMTISPLYLVLSGGVSGLLFLIAAILVIFRSTWTMTAVHCVAILWGLQYILEYMLLSQSVNPLRMLIMVVVVSGLFLLTIPKKNKVKPDEI